MTHSVDRTASGSQPVVVRDLRKSFGDLEALRGISFAVGGGSIFGLVGPNGAGKTTTLRCLLGLTPPSAGEVRVFGEDSRALSAATRQRLGYLSENPLPFGHLSMLTLFEVMAALNDRFDRVRAGADLARLDVPGDQALESMSLGQRRRAEFVLALATRPDLLVLDDPWLGLDASARHQMLTEVRRAAREDGHTVLFTSHILTDVEKLVDHVGILVRGRLRVCDELAALRQRVRRITLERSGAMPEIPELLASRESEAGLEVVTAGFTEELRERLARVASVRAIDELDLESLFVALTMDAGPGR